VFLRQGTNSHLGNFCAAAQTRACLPRYSRVPAVLLLAGVACTEAHECGAGCEQRAKRMLPDCSAQCSGAAAALDDAVRAAVAEVVCEGAAPLRACPCRRGALAQLLLLRCPVPRDSLSFTVGQSTLAEWIVAEQSPSPQLGST
jgi:hypothetical protein